MQAITGIASATISRCVLRVAQALGEMPLAPLNRSVLIVDSTSARVASREAKAYSGYKHHRCAKVQVVTRKDGQIVDVSQSYPGSVHDKRIWNVETTRLLPMLRGKVLADKAYAGAAGEGSLLHRPIKRGETAWKLDKESSKTRNATLSKVRVRIEHCFPRLKNWKVLSGLFPFHWTRLGDVVRALAVVHNVERHHASLEL